MGSAATTKSQHPHERRACATASPESVKNASLVPGRTSILPETVIVIHPPWSVLKVRARPNAGSNLEANRSAERSRGAAAARVRERAVRSHVLVGGPQYLWLLA